MSKRIQCPPRLPLVLNPASSLVGTAREADRWQASRLQAGGKAEYDSRPSQSPQTPSRGGMRVAIELEPHGMGLHWQLWPGTSAGQLVRFLQVMMQNHPTLDLIRATIKMIKDSRAI